METDQNQAEVIRLSLFVGLTLTLGACQSDVLKTSADGFVVMAWWQASANILVQSLASMTVRDLAQGDGKE